jgi:hypothetical protein
MEGIAPKQNSMHPRWTGKMATTGRHQFESKVRDASITEERIFFLVIHTSWNDHVDAIEVITGHAR